MGKSKVDVDNCWKARDVEDKKNEKSNHLLRMIAVVMKESKSVNRWMKYYKLEHSCCASLLPKVPVGWDSLAKRTKPKCHRVAHHVAVYLPEEMSQKRCVQLRTQSCTVMYGVK